MHAAPDGNKVVVVVVVNVAVVAVVVVPVVDVAVAVVDEAVVEVVVLVFVIVVVVVVVEVVAEAHGSSHAHSSPVVTWVPLYLYKANGLMFKLRDPHWISTRPFGTKSNALLPMCTRAGNAPTIKTSP